MINCEKLTGKSDVELFLIAAAGEFQHYANVHKMGNNGVDSELYEEECILRLYVKGQELKRIRNRQK